MGCNAAGGAERLSLCKFDRMKPAVFVQRGEFFAPLFGEELSDGVQPR